ncbi:lipase family protein [Roseimicrobium sp. ORNL1]|uniref:lipase family protein n=1 Tax=Roseimicrobium sp. ORNL1 TaxID=2711231 RepID=UPI0013E18A1B|nr:lipase family protein [Roseimicrobium sp. ORNL1]QIF00427.1 lipase family protein [Roseimicrobium sp. ORNL1]
MYTNIQTKFTLGILANAQINEKGDKNSLEASLSKNLDEGLLFFKEEIGEWERVWGPSVFQARPFSKYADQAVYVARRRDRADYVVALSAVNPSSIYDWLILAFNIYPQKRWPYSQDDPRIADGTQIALDHIRTLRSKRRSLLEFLKTIYRRSLVTVVGHSFGGTMAPVVASWLHEEMRFWDRNDQIDVSCLISGASTPGNLAFTQYYAGLGLAKRTTRIRNIFDPATYNFAANGMEKIPTLFGQEYYSEKIAKTIKRMRARAIKAGGYEFLHSVEDLKLRGQINENITGDDDESRWIAQAQEQHIWAYYDLMDTKKLLVVHPRPKVN